MISPANVLARAAATAPSALSIVITSSACAAATPQAPAHQAIANPLAAGRLANGHAAAPAAAAAASVDIGNFTFKAPIVTVKAGTTVTWTNGDDIPHTVVAKDGSFKSKVLDTGDRFSFTFARAGEFLYFCSLHPHMTGTIVVKA